MRKQLKSDVSGMIKIGGTLGSGLEHLMDGMISLLKNQKPIRQVRVIGLLFHVSPLLLSVLFLLPRNIYRFYLMTLVV